MVVVVVEEPKGNPGADEPPIVKPAVGVVVDVANKPSFGEVVDEAPKEKFGCHGVDCTDEVALMGDGANRLEVVVAGTDAPNKFVGADDVAVPNKFVA